MLDDFIAHLKKTKNQSLIARIYGVYTIKTNLFATLDVIIMANSSRLLDKKHDKLTFDIKGSTINRKSKISKRDWDDVKTSLNCGKVLKDINYLEIN